MDPITHGITGALLGKGFFSERYGRVALFAATLGSVFPDVDVFAEAVSRDPLAIIRYHRGITHSFVAMPFFALLLAWLTRWIARRRGIEAPSWWILALAYIVGIASHIVLDGMTSFGTRMWLPISSQRVAWDLLFIIDFSFTAIALLPQVAAWIYRDREKQAGRSLLLWVVFTLAAVGVWRLAGSVGYAFHFRAVTIASVVFAALFFLPARSDWGFRVTRARWCQAGTVVTIAYLFACAAAHHWAIERVQAFAMENHIAVARMAALPLPPSLLGWGGAIRSPDGVYQTRMDLRDSRPPTFRFTADSAPDAYVAEAMQLPETRLYWGFARFPVIRTEFEEGHHIVQFGENRFVNPRRNRPQPFTYQVVFDSNGKLLEEGWLTNGLFQQHMRRMAPAGRGDAP
ncbi:MAG TPA: metal-dependent hydrolase [Candidatus Sulfotelmatobacter sp.]|nr:metal-dependent hydrolase [Candidatus Sulfotelmatobacter sp.]